MGAVEIDMHLVIKSEDRPSGYEGDTIFGRALAWSNTKVKLIFVLLYRYVCPRSQFSIGTSERHMNNICFHNCYGKLLSRQYSFRF